MDKVHTEETNVSRWVLPISILGSSLGFIDSSVVNIGVPTIQDHLNASLATIQWVTNGYLLTLASLVLLGGATGDRYGSLRVFVIGLIVFALASIGCGIAPSAAVLVGARIVQGAGAAFLIPTSLALISQAYKGEARGRAIGTWAAAGGLLMALGPPFGGFLINVAGWRSIFFINIPLAALAIYLSGMIRTAGGRLDDRSLDVPGALLAIATLAALTYGLIVLGEGMARAGAIAIAAAVPLAVVFLLIEHRSAMPMMPLKLFGSRTFAGANALTVILYGGLGAAIFMLPFSMIRAHHYSSIAAGLAFLPLSLILGLGSRLSGSLADAVGNRLPLTIGPLIAGAGFATLALSANGENYATTFLPGLLIVGLGMTLAVPALTTAVFDSVADSDSGAASGINNAAARTGSLLATAALGIAFGSERMAAMSIEVLTSAYTSVMWCAALASAASAVIAFVSISKGNGSHEKAH
ncbi:MFS transporter [Rhizobium sp. BK376]|uniref:MFS transporter n=1 Tax=Rhizobium sp. BK376 TaxID=2512149 RepID=UPI00104B3D65|nr:MFS transporter [Rhizobium sp. BK376]TCR80801.1 EmrB/QacA subfamily drug resistance transporter [Rhizobium sp. BK376]